MTSVLRNRNFLDRVPQSLKDRKCFVRGRLQLFPAFSECLKQRRERHRVYLQQHSNEQRDLLPNGRVKLASFVCLLLSWNIGPESEQLKCPSHKPQVHRHLNPVAYHPFHLFHFATDGRNPTIIPNDQNIAKARSRKAIYLYLHSNSFVSALL